MTKQQRMTMERVGRLQYLGFSFIQDIAKCEWLAVWLVGWLHVLQNDYRKLWTVKAEFSARFRIQIGRMEIKFGTRQQSSVTLCALRVARV